MANSVGTVSIDLEARIAKFESDLGRAARLAEQRAAQIRKSFTTIAAALGAVVSAGVLVHFIDNALKAQDAMVKLAQKTGIATETLSGWTYAAKQAGLEGTAFESGLIKLSKAQSDAANGVKTQADAFAALGIKVTDASGKLRPTAEVFADIADKFAKAPDGAQKTAMAVALFGRAGAQLIPLLNAGSAGLDEYIDKAKMFGMVVSTDSAHAAERFNDALEQLGDQSKGVANTVATALAPALADLAEKAVGFFQSQKWADTLATISNLAKTVADNIDAIIAAVKMLATIYLINMGAKMVAATWDWIGVLVAAATQMDALGVKSKVAFAEQVKGIGYVKTAFLGLQAWLIGWQIGTYLRDQFLVVRLAGITMVDVLLTGWERLKEGALLAWSAISNGWAITVAAIKSGFKETITAASYLVQAQGNFEGAAQMRDYAASISTASDALDAYGKEQAQIRATADANVATIHKLTNEQKEAEKWADKQTAKPPPTPEPPPTAPGNDLPTTLATTTSNAKAAAAAMDALGKAVDNATAKNAAGADKQLAEQVAALRGLAEAGAKAIAAGNDVAAVQLKVAQGVAQVNAYYAAQVDEVQKAADDYTRAMEKRLALDKQALDLQVAGVGMGDKEIAQQQKILEIHQQAADDVEALNQRHADKSVGMTQKQYDDQLAQIQQYEAARVVAAQNADDAITAAQSNWMNGAQRAMQNFIDGAANAAGLTETLFTNAFDGMADAFATFATTGKLAFKSLTVSILSDLAKMEARMAESKFLAALVGGASGSSAGIGGSGTASLFAKGGVQSSPSLAAYANGVYNTPKHFMFARGAVGTFAEAGPEAIMPLSRGADGKLGVKGGGGAGNVQVNTVVNVNNDGTASSTTSSNSDNARAVGAMIETKVREVISKEQRPGGQLWRMANG